MTGRILLGVIALLGVILIVTIAVVALLRIDVYVPIVLGVIGLVIMGVLSIIQKSVFRALLRLRKGIGLHIVSRPDGIREESTSTAKPSESRS